jgi:Fe-S cluster biogenesis protein NfuA
MNIRLLNELNSYIELELAPPIREHGGEIKLHRVEGTTIVLELTGACVLCPADTMTKKGLELQLKAKFDFIEKIEFENSETNNFKLTL